METEGGGVINKGNTINSDDKQHYIKLNFDGDYKNGTGNYSQIRGYNSLCNYWGSQMAFYTTQSGAANTLKERMRINANGNIRIGTSSPDASSTINGTVYSTSVIIDANIADYVFEPTCKLPALFYTKYLSVASCRKCWN